MRNIVMLVLLLVLSTTIVWSQSTLNFPVPTDAVPAGYAVLNPGPAAASVTFTAYSDALDGALIASVTLTVPAEGQISKLSTDLFPGKTNSRGGLPGWVQATSATSGLLGIEATGDFATDVEAINSATPSADQILPVSGRTQIYVGNPGTSAMTVAVKAYDANGVQVGTTITKTLQPKSLYDSYVTDGIYFGTNQVPTFASVKHLRITATGPVVATAILFTTMLPSGRDAAAVNGTDVAGAPSEANFPHVVNGPLGEANYASLVSITNPTASTQTLMLTFSPDSGAAQSIQSTILPNGSLQRTIQELFSLGSGYIGGWLKVQGTAPLVGYVAFGETTGGGIDLVPVQPMGKTMLLFAHIADLAPWMTGLALLNTSATDATVEVFAMNPDGSLVGGAQNLSTARFTLPAKTRTAKLLQELIPATQSRTADGGFVYIRTANNIPLLGMELFFLRSGAAMANVAAEAAPLGITYTPPYPTSPGVSVAPPLMLWGASVRTCLEEKIGIQATHDLQNNLRQPTETEAQAMKDCNAPSPVYEKLDPAIAPTDQQVRAKVGAVEITYYNPLTMSLLENGAVFTFVARNTGSTKLTLRALFTYELQQALPSWITHLYPIFQMPHISTPPNNPLAADMVLDPGASTTFEWFASNDASSGQATYTVNQGYLTPLKKQVSLPFRFDVLETGESTTLGLDVVAYDGGMIELLNNMAVSATQPAAIVGRLTTRDGQPIPNADIQVQLISKNNNTPHLRTDSEGRYATQVPSIDDLKKYMGHDLEPYGKLAYFVWAAVPGYSLGYRGGIAPAPGQTVTVDMVLDPAGVPLSYHMIGETRTDGIFGYWWTMFTPGLDAVEAVQGDHPVQPEAPGHAIKVDFGGRQIWRTATGQQCWGFDVAPNGLWTAAVCYDNFLYIFDRQGNSVQKFNAPAYQVRFSPDSKSIVASSPDRHVSLLDVATGKILWTYDGHDGTVRNVRWSADGSRISIGFDGGQVAQLTPEGKLLWQTAIGEYPLYFAVDSRNNVYGGGKSLLLFSWDGNGNLRWRQRTANTLNNGLGGVTNDGSYMVTHSFNSELAAYDGEGHVLWQRNAPSATGNAGTGHQGLQVTPDGQWTALGIWDGSVVVLDRTGTVRWSYSNPDPPGTRPPGQDCYSPTCNAAQSVNISNDGKYLAVGFENSVIRIFQRDP